MNKTPNETGNNLHEFYRQIALAGGLPAKNIGGWSVVGNEAGAWPRLIYGVCAGKSGQPESSVLHSELSPELLITSDENIRELDPFLRTKGFYPFAVWNGMAISNRSDSTASKMPVLVEIVKPTTTEEIDEWLEIVNSEIVAPEVFRKSLFERLDDQPNFEAYLLKNDGIGVSTILVFTTENSTGLYLIATKKTSQKQGFASLLVRQILWQISLKSEKSVILHATQKGRGLYSKVGFQPVNQFFLYRNLNTRV